MKYLSFFILNFLCILSGSHTLSITRQEHIKTHIPEVTHHYTKFNKDPFKEFRNITDKEIDETTIIKIANILGFKKIESCCVNSDNQPLLCFKRGIIIIVATCTLPGFWAVVDNKNHFDLGQYSLDLTQKIS